MFDRVVNDINCDKVIIDDFKAIQEAVNALVKKGRKHIGFISTISNLNVGDLRRHGYEDAIKDRSKPIILNISDAEDCQNQIKKFLNQHSEIDGVIAADNMSGSIFINVATSLGYNIPKDVSVIGFADATISNMTVPRLAYVNQDAENIGRNAVNLMVKRLENNTTEVYKTKHIKVTLFEQESL